MFFNGRRHFVHSVSTGFFKSPSAFQFAALLQQGDDRQVLGTGGFALAALDAVAGAALFAGDVGVFADDPEMCAALLAQNYDSKTAAITAVEHHALTAYNLGETAFDLSPEKIINNL